MNSLILKIHFICVPDLNRFPVDFRRILPSSFCLLPSKTTIGLNFTFYILHHKLYIHSASVIGFLTSKKTYQQINSDLLTVENDLIGCFSLYLQNNSCNV